MKNLMKARLPAFTIAFLMPYEIFVLKSCMTPHVNHILKMNQVDVADALDSP